MCIARTARRRRKQAANNYRHMSKQRRPKYSKVDPLKSERRMRLRIETEKRMRQKKK